MNIDLVKTFLEAYRQGSMSKAATSLNLTQPAVSQQIQAIENHIGHPLFYRTTKGITATPMGHDLARDVTSHIDALTESMSVRQSTAHKIVGSIQLGCPQEFFSYYNKRIVSPLHHAGLTINIQLAGKVDLYEWLKSGDIDLAITASEPNDKELSFRRISTERLLLVAAPFLKTQLKKETISVEWLSRQPLLAYDPQLPLVRQYLQHRFMSNETFKPVVSCPDLRILVELCKDLQAWSVLPDYIANPHLLSGDLILLDEINLAPINYLNLVWRPQSLRTPRVAFAKKTLEKAFE
jgi:DNA-binding transcriptional LysR family regulator